MLDSAATNAQWLIITLSGDAADSFTVGFLGGDVNRGGATDTTDASQIKLRFGQTPANGGIGGCDPEWDFNCDGVCSTTDFSQIKLRFGTSLP